MRIRYKKITLIITASFVAIVLFYASLFGPIIKDSYLKSFKTDSYGSVVLYYTENMDAAVEPIKAYLEEGIIVNDKLWGKEELPELKLYLHSDAQKYKDYMETKRDKVEGNKDDIVDLLIEDVYRGFFALSEEPALTKERIMKIYSNYRMNVWLRKNNISGSNIPRWFTEGTLAYLSKPKNTTIKEGTFSTMSFKSLTSSKDWEKNSQGKMDAYIQSYCAVDELILEKGEEGLKKIFISSKDMGFDAAFASVMQYSVENYESSYLKNWVKSTKNRTGTVAMNKVDYEKIGKAIESYISKHPSNLDAYIDLSKVYMMLKEDGKREDILVRAILQNPSADKAYYELGYHYLTVKNYDKSLENFKRALELKPDNSSYASSLSEIELLFNGKEAVTFANKASELAQKQNSSSYAFIKNKAESIKKYVDSAKTAASYEACLSLVKSEYLSSSSLKIALIDKTLSEYSTGSTKLKNDMLKLRKELSKS